MAGGAVEQQCFRAVQEDGFMIPESLVVTKQACGNIQFGHSADVDRHRFICRHSSDLYGVMLVVFSSYFCFCFPGNAMGYVRMIRSGGLHCCSNAIRYGCVIV